MYFEIYQDNGALTGLLGRGRQWRWRLKAANHEPIAHGEAYVNKADCVRVVNLLKQTGTFTPVKML